MSSSNKFLLSTTEMMMMMKLLKLLFLLLLYSLGFALTLPKFIHIFVAGRRQLKGGNNMLGYIFAQSALLYALLFVIINIYSVYSIYFGVGHFRGYIIYK